MRDSEQGTWSICGGDRRVTPCTSARPWNSPRAYIEAELGILSFTLHVLLIIEDMIVILMVIIILVR